MHVRKPRKYEAAVAALKRRQSLVLLTKRSVARSVALKYGRSYGRRFQVTGGHGRFVITRVD